MEPGVAHALLRLPCKLIEHGYTGNSAGAMTEFSYTTVFTFNTMGQVLTIDGPRVATGDVIGFTCDDPWSFNLLSTGLALAG